MLLVVGTISERCKARYGTRGLHKGAGAVSDGRAAA